MLPQFIFGTCKDGTSHSSQKSDTQDLTNMQSLLQAKVEILNFFNTDFELRKLCRKYGIIENNSIDSIGPTNTESKSELGGDERYRNSPSSSIPMRNMHLFEVKRRFRSAVDTGRALDKYSTEESVEGESVDFDEGSDSTASAYDESSDEDDQQLPVNEIDGQETCSAFHSTRSSSGIYEDAFTQLASSANHEMGHGGFLTETLARLTFRAGCVVSNRRRHLSSRSFISKLIRNFDSDLDIHPSSFEDQSASSDYWTLYDAVFLDASLFEVDQTIFAMDMN